MGRGSARKQTEKGLLSFWKAGGKRAFFLPAILVFIPILSFFVFMTDSFGAPKRIPTSQPAKCSTCHGKENVLPKDHTDISKMKFKDCLSCHEKNGPQQLEGKLPGSHIHMLSGVTCAKCHKNLKKPEALTMQQCATCHNPDKLAEKTAEVKPHNPHTSPHYGTTLDCNVCHHQHSKSENFCAQCHDFKFVVP